MQKNRGCTDDTMIKPSTRTVHHYDAHLLISSKTSYFQASKNLAKFPSMEEVHTPSLGQWIVGCIHW